MTDNFDPNATIIDDDVDVNMAAGPAAGGVADGTVPQATTPVGPAEWVARFWPEWSVVRCLGCGSFGFVYELSKTVMGYTSKAAAKIILVPNTATMASSGSGADQDYFTIARRMHDEVRVMSELSGQRNIVIIQDSAICERDDAPGYALGIRMELLQSLPDRQQQLGSPFPVEEAVRVAMDISRALVICHGRNIMHRDVKPENVFWSNKLGEYKLGDFGISKQLEATAGTWGARTSIGTPQYEAPEVIKRQEYSYNVDVYSLGVMLFQLLNHGRSPFLPAYPEKISENDVWSAEGRRIGGEEFPNPACGDEYLADLIRSATAGDPKRRFHNAQAFHNALEAWPGWGSRDAIVDKSPDGGVGCQ